MLTNKELLEQLKEKAKWGVLRHHPSYYPYFLEHEPSEGNWLLKEHCEESLNLFPMDRFEFREDGELAQVFEVRNCRCR